MNKDKYIFAQLVSFLDRSKFNRLVAKFQGDKYVKHFTCWNQLLVLMFGQLCNRESLRDLICALLSSWLREKRLENKPRLCKPSPRLSYL